MEALAKAKTHLTADDIFKVAEVSAKNDRFQHRRMKRIRLSSTFLMCS